MTTVERRLPAAFTRSMQKTDRIRVLLVADPQKGKSFAAATFPLPAVVDSEDSVRWLRDRFPDLVGAPVTTIDDAIALVESLADPRATGCDTIIVDGITKLHHRAVESVPKEQRTSDGKPKESAWFSLKEKEKRLIDAACLSGKNVVLTAWPRSLKINPADAKSKRYTTVDYDEDALFMVDFAFEIIELRGGTNAIARCMKTRSPLITREQIIENFSYSTLARLLKFEQPATAVAQAPPAVAEARAQPQTARALGAGARIGSSPGQSVPQAQREAVREIYRFNGFFGDDDKSPQEEDHADLRAAVAAVSGAKVAALWGDVAIEHLRAYLAKPLPLTELRSAREKPTQVTKFMQPLQRGIIEGFVQDGVMTIEELTRALAQFKNLDGTPKTKIGELFYEEARLLISQTQVRL